MNVINAIYHELKPLILKESKVMKENLKREISAFGAKGSSCEQSGAAGNAILLEKNCRMRAI